MQFETLLRARVPRSRCREYGVKTIDVPLGGTGLAFYAAFECFAIEVLWASRSLAQERELLRLSWDALQRIMDRAVQRGLFFCGKLDLYPL